MRRGLLLSVPACVGMLSAAPPSSQAVATVLDDWHEAAAKADETRYFGHLAEDAVFLGTDATERWDRKAFQAFAHPYFAKGKAWSFKAVRRSIMFSRDGHTAWFDEDLDTPTMGPCRGSGVLTYHHGRWRIRHYNLTIPIPNPLTEEFKTRIETHLKGAAKKEAT